MFLDPEHERDRGVPPDSTHRCDLFLRDLEIFLLENPSEGSSPVPSSQWELVQNVASKTPRLPRNGPWAHGAKIATVSNKAKDFILALTHALNGMQLLGSHDFLDGTENVSLIENAHYFANKNLQDPELKATWNQAVTMNVSGELTPRCALSLKICSTNKCEIYLKKCCLQVP